MKLIDFLSQHAITAAEFASRIGVAETKTVYRYISNDRIPAADIMKRIWSATDGQVGPSDFYSLDPIDADHSAAPTPNAVTGSTPNGEAA